MYIDIVYIFVNMLILLKGKLRFEKGHEIPQIIFQPICNYEYWEIMIYCCIFSKRKSITKGYDCGTQSKHIFWLKNLGFVQFSVNCFEETSIVVSS